MSRNLYRLTCLILTGAAVLWPSQSPAAGTLQVHQAWIEESPPGIAVTAAYLDIENPSEAEVRIVKVASPAAERVEIHRTEFRENTATMTRLPELVLPAHARLSFATSGHHLMLFGSIKPPHAGDKVELQLTLGDGGVVSVKADVRREAAPQESPP